MNKGIVQNATITGLLSALSVFIYLLLLHLLGQNPFGQYKFMYIGIYALIFALGLRHFRDKKNHNRLSATQGLGFGFIVTAVAAIACTLMVFGFLNSFGQSAFDLYLKESIELLVASKDFIVEQLGEDAYLTTYDNLQKLTPSELALDHFTSMSLTGVFLTFLFMLIFKN
ncbi:DUF4199 domain-containing protein [Flammeovirgaceae bacterium SG7u.111]|nr:DUF4199 domain-containing protein [Flammeovirgaceae bacterium SG7u.132]WPO34512.1 DUF4199 domain-containing protein [Flammeovirgaceae bacterium SG7u.111]